MCSSPASGGGGERSEPEGVSSFQNMALAPSVIALRALTAPPQAGELFGGAPQ